MYGLMAALVLALMVTLPAAGLAWASGSQDLRLAYLDPGAGSFIVQLLIAALAGVAVAGRLYWTKLKRLLGMSSVDDDDEGPDSDDD